ncbi:hypothetical protein [Parasphingopyxis marina]|uniref:PEP-CTERM protein-sorting domain-containing protein n=1 Tax=Parasphingopyxis marina TaxID=2761622 RepID=A0A842HU04_9SPHN|nr:hypothetical protein [Parasphingopyxis marina]MBC2776415.1 hypothetical protein [Parasphingopyxis marina]
MSYLRIMLAFAAAFAIGGAPALAASAISVDAPGDMMLFGLGVTGLIIGRQISKRRKKKEPDPEG